jgi:hypothetical protein
MSGQSITTASTLMCPHGGTVSIVSSNTSASTNGGAMALATDTFTISGCPFQIPAPSGTVPSPCVQVQWVVTDMRNTVNGVPTLSSSSVGLCLAATMVPQGTVSVVSADQQVSTQ